MRHSPAKLTRSYDVIVTSFVSVISKENALDRPLVRPFCRLLHVEILLINFYLTVVSFLAHCLVLLILITSLCKTAIVDSPLVESTSTSQGSAGAPHLPAVAILLGLHDLRELEAGLMKIIHDVVIVSLYLLKFCLFL